MKALTGVTAAALLMILAAGTCLAQTEIPKMLGSLDVYGIKKLQITSSATGYSMMLLATFTNANAEAVRLRNGDFEVTFDKPEGGEIRIGQTRLTDQVVPGKTGDRPGQSDVTLNVSVGPQSQTTMEKILDAINIIGNPSVPLRIGIKGRAEVGLQLPRGWIYEQGKKFEVDLGFTPAIQREFLLK